MKDKTNLNKTELNNNTEIKLTSNSNQLTLSPTFASKRYKHVKFLAPPRPCKNTFLGDCRSPLRFLKIREHSDGVGSSPLRALYVSPPKFVSINS